MRVLVTGGRDFDDREMLFAFLDRLHEEQPFTLLIHGDARGADRLCGEWASERTIECLPCPADWRRHGRAAGPIRNGQMLEHKPDILVAFPGGKGTANMIEQATKAGLRVLIAQE